MPPSDPLLDPTILTHLGRHLSTTAGASSSSDLIRCLRVCSVWHETLAPFLWHHLSLPHQEPHKERHYHHYTSSSNQPSLISLLKYRHHIRSLRLTGHNSLVNHLLTGSKPGTLCSLAETIAYSAFDPKLRGAYETVTTFFEEEEKRGESDAVVLRQARMYPSANTIGTIPGLTLNPGPSLTHLQITRLSPAILALISQSRKRLCSLICRSNKMARLESGQDPLFKELFQILASGHHHPPLDREKDQDGRLERFALKELRIGPAMFSESIQDWIEKVFFNLETLELHRIKSSRGVQDPPQIHENKKGDTVSVPVEYTDHPAEYPPTPTPIPPSFRLSKLRSLTLNWNDFPAGSAFELVRQAPGIQHLEWKRNAQELIDALLKTYSCSPSKTSASCSEPQADRNPNFFPLPPPLVSLNLSHANVSDQDLAKVLSLFPGLVRLNLQETQAGIHTASYLLTDPTRRDKEILELDVRGCEGMTTEVIENLASKWTRLQIVSVPSFQDGTRDGVHRSLNPRVQSKEKSVGVVL